MVMVVLMGTMENQFPPALQPSSVVARPPSRYTHGSIETLVVVLAVIIIIGAIAGIIAQLCGASHFGGSEENDVEGWVEKKCRSCIDGGVPSAPPPPLPPPPPLEESKAAIEEAK
ncbi:hypothetical protein SLEP1_g35135 [Rubroshorea leprosula]|uniref:Uncharacterized protein n=1 Tax=Rubroshorea leprosula TaxID=152421 RepID=A0AAV5KM89_9ROSI|nr:hypothetical protein SLEP1_g35135 [Rubroshorea leprosula]